MFLKGQKVVCVDDQFLEEFKPYFQILPRKGRVYVVRNCFLGTTVDKQPTFILFLIGIPGDTTKFGREMGFNSNRFRSLEEMQTRAKT